MPVLPNARHERFCQSVASGKTADAAYVAAGFKPSRKNASRLRTNEDISRRIAELNDAVAQSVVYDKIDCVRDLVAMIQAEPDAAGPTNRLSNKLMSKAGPYYALPDKLAVIARLAKMLGWDESDKVQVDASEKVLGFLDWIGRRKK